MVLARRLIIYMEIIYSKIRTDIFINNLPVMVDKADAYKALAKLPSAQQWIPCSERLPEINEHHVSEPCIVYCSNGAYGFAELEENFFGQVWWDCERDDEYHEPLGEVLAWMPLPEPYKE